MALQTMHDALGVLVVEDWPAYDAAVDYLADLGRLEAVIDDVSYLVIP